MATYGDDDFVVKGHRVEEPKVLLFYARACNRRATTDSDG